MNHPKFKVIEININNGIKEEKPFTKFLMFRNEAARTMDFMNQHNGSYEDINNCHYYVVADKENNIVLTQRISKLKNN